MAGYHPADDSSVSPTASPSLAPPKFDTSRIVTFKRADDGNYPTLIIDRIRLSPLFNRVFIYQLKDLNGVVWSDGVWIPESKLRPAEIQSAPQIPPLMEPAYHQHELAPDPSMKHLIAVKSTPRPFPCLLRPLCTLTFGSKNEWKRHTSIQHLCLGYFRCKLPPCDTTGGSTPGSKDPKPRFNDFNRKDLFTQHIRRKHMPKKFRKPSGATNDVAQRDWEAKVLPDIHKEMWVEVRQPPKRLACGCGRIYDGYEAWQERMECLGRHLKNGPANKYDTGMDPATAAWLTGEGMDPEMVRWMEGEGLLVKCPLNEIDSCDGYRFPKENEIIKPSSPPPPFNPYAS
ncbi:MAG: hypothetical protein M1814_004992 [Vezdaea aestivalis]|nr:MAG: hypothetical protein M1814_004992 [Vezdaea aestivalis]